MWRRRPLELPLDREDVTSIIGGLADILANVLAIRSMLEDESGGEEEEETDS